MKKLIALIIVVAMVSACLAGCTAAPASSSSAPANEPRQAITADLAGNPITLPASASKIVSLAAANTDILTALGLGDKLIAIDSYSADIAGVPADVIQLDMMQPDTEQLVALGADIIFVSVMSNAGGDDVFKPVRDAGACVVAVPTAASIEEIKTTITFMGDATGSADEAAKLITTMDNEIQEVCDAVAKVTDKKTVYIEVGAEPKLYTLGSGTFLDEMLSLAGGVNIFADQEGWLAVSEENVVAANPDVIFTNIGYMPDPVGDIAARNGWEVVTAVKDKQVYQIDEDSSTLATHNITLAMRQMAKAMYPELSGSLE